MCGIAGIIGAKANKGVLEKMLIAQQHRGPDNTGIFKSDGVMLGHNRLSIIDLTSESNQPFKDSLGRYTITFNGEIYNYIELKKELNTYSFKTNSDTEVLLAAYLKWGNNCLEKLNGMFSFAIWDAQEKKLFAARDRFGVKPFFYHLKNNTLYFASEIKALFAAGITTTKNEKVWANYFAYGSYGMPNETFYEDIHQLPGSHFLTFKDDILTIEKWYHFEKEVLKYTISESFETVKKKYKSLLEESIHLRFRADVNVGFNLSGGLDSSALLAFVNKTSTKQNIKAYTFFTGDKKYDELFWVEEMLKHTNNPLTKVKFNVDDDFEDKANFISKIQDEPFGGIPTLAYSQIFKKARELNTIVLLDGQGMDEQWAGYDYYLKNSESTIQGVKSSPFKKNVLQPDFLNLASKPVYPTPFKSKVLNTQYRDLFYTKIPRALRFNDRVSMAYSTELREPFLDYRLVEYAFAQPLEFKIKGGIQKYLLRKIVSEDLSNTITYAPKRPLQTPQREWLQKELYGFVKENIAKIKNSNAAPWFNFTALTKELESYKKGNIDSSFHIWQWLNLGLILNN